MALENEDADPVGMPATEESRRAGRALAGPRTPAPKGDAPPDPQPKPRALDQEKEDFTAEGAPPPGRVGTSEPVRDLRDAPPG